MIFGSVFQTQWNIKNLICGLGFFQLFLNQQWNIKTDSVVWRFYNRNMSHDPRKDATLFANFFSEHLDLDLMATSSTQPIKFKVQVMCTRPATLSSDPPCQTSSIADP